MIASLHGILQHKDTNHIIIDVHGVGYEVFISETAMTTLPAENEEIILHIHTHVREDALQLFGFTTRADKQSYQLLLSVSGVGPKLAMAIVAAITPGELARAVSNEDIDRLTSVSGVGKKTAKRLCLELKDKVKFSPDLPQEHPKQAEKTITNPAYQDCLSALVNLGYDNNAAQEAVNCAQDNLDDNAGLEDLLRLALQSLV